jgi:ankyrin repeat protein
VADLLLEFGADPNEPNNIGITALMTSARADAPDAVRVLARNGAALDTAHAQYGGTALHFAAVQGIVEAIRAWLEEGCDSQVRDGGGCTARHMAEDHDQDAAVQCLDQFVPAEDQASDDKLLWTSFETAGMRELKCSLQFSIACCA